MKSISKIWFTFKSMNISGGEIPSDVAQKILDWHMIPMSYVRELLGIKIWASQKSCWRPVWWEHSKGRSGNSQHCFKGKGATDWTCENFVYNKDKLLKAIIENTDYTRMCVYDTFIHCDYKETKNNKRILFEYRVVNDKWQWKFKKFI